VPGLDTDWRKSTRSNNVGSCVEVRQSGVTVEIRDTKDRQRGPTLRFDRREWTVFTNALRSSALSAVPRSQMNSAGSRIRSKGSAARHF